MHYATDPVEDSGSYDNLGPQVFQNIAICSESDVEVSRARVRVTVRSTSWDDVSLRRQGWQEDF